MAGGARRRRPDRRAGLIRRRPGPHALGMALSIVMFPCLAAALALTAAAAAGSPIRPPAEAAAAGGRPLRPRDDRRGPAGRGTAAGRSRPKPPATQPEPAPEPQPRRRAAESAVTGQRPRPPPAPRRRVRPSPLTRAQRAELVEAAAARPAARRDRRAPASSPPGHAEPGLRSGRRRHRRLDRRARGQWRCRHLLRRGATAGAARRSLPGQHPGRPGRRRARSSSPATGRRSNPIQARMAAARAADRGARPPALRRRASSTSSWCRRRRRRRRSTSTRSARRPRRGRYPVGGHFKTTVAADGSVAASRGFTNACLDVAVAEPAPGAQPRAARGHPFAAIRCRPRSTSSCRSGPAAAGRGRRRSAAPVRGHRRGDRRSPALAHSLRRQNSRPSPGRRDFRKIDQAFRRKKACANRRQPQRVRRGHIWERRGRFVAARLGRIHFMTSTRLALVSALLLAGAAPLIAQPGHDAAAAAVGRLALRALGRRPCRARFGDQAGRRFLAPRQQPLVPGQPDPGRPPVLGRLHGAQRGCRGAVARHRRDRQSRHRSGQPPGRRHVCELDGRGRDRGARHRAAAAPISTESPPRQTATT